MKKSIYNFLLRVAEYPNYIDFNYFMARASLCLTTHVDYGECTAKYFYDKDEEAACVVLYDDDDNIVWRGYSLEALKKYLEGLELWGMIEED